MGIIAYDLLLLELWALAVVMTKKSAILKIKKRAVKIFFDSLTQYLS
jgi:hypothetical protein